MRQEKVKWERCMRDREMINCSLRKAPPKKKKRREKKGVTKTCERRKDINIRQKFQPIY